MLTKAYAAAILGIGAEPVEIEVHAVPAEDPHTRVVGLPDAAVKESIDRVRAALRNSGYKLKPAAVTVNLAPADLRKEGPVYDLPIALALIAASSGLSLPALARVPALGELALSGEVRRVRGVLPIVLALRKAGFRQVMVPEANGEEAALVEGIEVWPVRSLTQAAAILAGQEPPQVRPYAPAAFAGQAALEDFADVKGQHAARRAIEVAVSGGHNLLMIGSPGSGKTMLARRIPSILPPLSMEEALEVTAIHSVAGALRGSVMTQRPFRAPHHTVSDAGLIGGGTHPTPGEVSLAHRGVLFLDELPEFHRRVLRVRALQAERYRTLPGIRCNADLPAGKLQRFCPLEPAAETLLRSAMNELALTARAYTRILRVARTIADMAGSETISQAHLFEAVQYRALDRAQW